MIFLRIDLRSSSVKESVFDPEEGKDIGAVCVLDFQMKIIS